MTHGGGFALRASRIESRPSKAQCSDQFGRIAAAAHDRASTLMESEAMVAGEVRHTVRSVRPREPTAELTRCVNSLRASVSGFIP
eukprot:6184841-Pleurochrysis_carterae.AAC.2